MQKKGAVTKKAKEKNFRQLKKFIRGLYGPDDGSFKPTKSTARGIQMIKNEDLEQEYINNNDTKL